MNNHVIATLLYAITVVSLLTGCSDDEPGPQDKVIAKIKSASNNQQSIHLEYDNQGRAVKLQNTASEQTTATFAYGDHKVTVYYAATNGTTTTNDTVVYQLDPNGYVSSLERLDPSAITQFWGCNAQGYRLFSSYTQDISNNLVYHTDCHYNSQTGLLDSISYKLNGKWYSSVIISAYDTSKPYSLRSENMGQAFVGEEYLHPPLSGVNKSSLGGSLTSTTFSYAYVYDDRDRITRATETRSNGTTITTTYTYY